MKDNIIEEKEEFKATGIRGFYYKSFEEEESGNQHQMVEGKTWLA